MNAEATTLTLIKKIVIKTSNETSALSATKAPRTSIVAISKAEPNMKTNLDVGIELMLEIDCSKNLEV